MRNFLEHIMSFLISGALGWLGVVIRYSNKIRNEEVVKLKWFLSELITGMLLAWAVYSVLPDGGIKVPLAVFVGYFSHTVLDILDKKMPKIFEDRIDELSKSKEWKNTK